LTAGPAFKVGDIEPSSGRQILHPDADINPILDRVTAASPPFRAALDEVTAAVPGAHVFGVRVETNVERILEKIAGSAPRTRRQGPISLR